MFDKIRRLLSTRDSALVVIVISLIIAFSIIGATTVPDESGYLVRSSEDILSQKKIYSQYDEELIIRDFFGDRRNGVFLDVGCAWPIRISTTFYLEEHLGWTGIGIDAVAEYQPLWEARRPNTKFFHYAVSDTSGDTVTFHVLPSVPGLSSLYKEQVALWTDAEPKLVEVQTITLTDLLNREGVKKIDFLSMDIEGAEVPALSGFDIDKFAPELICIEAHSIPENEAIILKYFTDHGYRHLEEFLPRDFANWYFARNK